MQCLNVPRNLVVRILEFHNQTREREEESIPSKGFPEAIESASVTIREDFPTPPGAMVALTNFRIRW